MSVGPITDACGVQRWYDADGKLHQDGDLPAVVWPGITQWWYKHGTLHRDGDLPAVVWVAGSDEVQEWYQHGQRHRDGDLPAMVWLHGSKMWWKHGKQHRDGNLPAVVRSRGYKAKTWYQHGRLRFGGLPAVMLPDRSQEWWVDGVRQTSEDRARTRRWSALRAAFVGAVAANAAFGAVPKSLPSLLFKRGT